MAPPPPPMATVVIAGSDVADTQLVSGSSTTYGDAQTLLWDGPLHAGDWILVRPSLDLLSAADTILSATLEYYNFNSGDAAEVFECTSAWDEATVTYGTLQGGSPYSSTAHGTRVGSASGGSGAQTLDVTSSIHRWLADPTSNHGWIFVPTGGNNGVEFYSSEYTGPEVRTCGDRRMHPRENAARR